MEELVKRDYLYRGRILNFRVDTVRLPDGRETLREVAEHPGAVVVVALDGEGDVLLVKQYRHAVGQDMLELPAGTIDPGENPEETAPRELQEETGYTAQRWDRLARYYSSPGVLTEEMYLYLARDLTPGTKAPRDDEDLEGAKIPLREALDLVARGLITDAKTIIGLLLAEQKLNRITAL